MVSKRINILLSAYACEPNKGSEPGVGWNWATHLSDKYEVHVITRENNRDVIEQYLKEHPIDHIHFYYYDCTGLIKKIKKLPNGIFMYYKQWQKGILPLAKRIVQDEGIEIIHHITFNEFRTPGKLYKLGKPFVWGPIGGGQFYNPSLKEAYFNEKDIIKEKLRNCINRCYLNFSKDIHNVVKEAAAILIADPSTENVMPKSRKYYRLLETAYNLDRNSIKCFDEQYSGPIRLLWVGGIWPRKGLKILLDALGESNFREFKLDIIGIGEDKSKCERLVKNYGLEKYITFRGELSYQQVNELYDAADLFVFTSLRDTSGNVVLEAMSHGLPVITMKHHGVGEMVTPETGTLIEVTDYQTVKLKYIQAIKNYYKNRELIVKQGKNARLRIEKVYSWEHNVEVVNQVYSTVLEGQYD